MGFSYWLGHIVILLLFYENGRRGPSCSFVVFTAATKARNSTMARIRRIIREFGNIREYGLRDFSVKIV